MCTHVLKTVVNGSLDIESVESGILRRDVYFVALEAAFTQSETDLKLIPVRLSSICTPLVSSSP